MTLVKQESDRLDRDGNPFVNLFLCWRYEGKIHYLRIRPQFKKEYRILKGQAVHVPLGEPLAKYVD